MYLGLALMLSGVVVGGAYLYHYYILEVRNQPRQGWEGTSYSSEVKRTTTVSTKLNHHPAKTETELYDLHEGGFSVELLD